MTGGSRKRTATRGSARPSWAWSCAPWCSPGCSDPGSARRQAPCVAALGSSSGGGVPRRLRCRPRACGLHSGGAASGLGLRRRALPDRRPQIVRAALLGAGHRRPNGRGGREHGALQHRRRELGLGRRDVRRHLLGPDDGYAFTILGPSGGWRIYKVLQGQEPRTLASGSMSSIATGEGTANMVQRPLRSPGGGGAPGSRSPIGGESDAVIDDSGPTGFIGIGMFVRAEGGAHRRALRRAHDAQQRLEHPTLSGWRDAATEAVVRSDVG